MNKVIERYTRLSLSGGKNTNKNGLLFERDTQLKYIITKDGIKFDNYNKVFINISKGKFYKYFNINIDKRKILHGCKLPDEVYLRIDRKIVFIIEKKFQKSGGSVCEKLQTGIEKKKWYSNLLPSYTIVYIYCLSKWFITNCRAEIELLETNNIIVFTDDINKYKKKIINFMVNYNTIIDRIQSKRKTL